MNGRWLLAAGIIALGLTFVFWQPLWAGAGVIGGDTYTYYFPQKLVYQSSLREGRLPWWNALVGHGYPQLAESQTGVFYPFHLALYSSCSISTAYNAVILLHYVLAFVGAWLFARRLSWSQPASLLTALVFTYGWFPPRLCLEWAIVTGAWLPWAMWCAESYLQSRRWRYLAGLSLVLAVQLLAGHYHLAFITDLVLVAYLVVRAWAGGGLPVGQAAAPTSWTQSPWLLVLAIGLGFGLAGVQLWPTWELKQTSQRRSVGPRHDPNYGFLPAWYLSQCVAPWMWYLDDVDLNRALPPESSKTNPVEAHLYFGLLPLLLAAWCLWTESGPPRRFVWGWAGIGAAGVVLATAVLSPLTNHLPGFGFFAGPGRYGLMTTLAVALLAGRGLDELMSRLSPRTAIGVCALGLALTTADLWLVSRLVGYVTFVPGPPIERLASSPVRRLLKAQTQPVRLFCRGANLPTLLGVASTPPYLGIGPAAYFDPQLTMPEPLPYEDPPTPQQVDWLRRAGVTHVLSFASLDAPAWPVRLQWAGDDPFLNLAWNRYTERQPVLYLYQLLGSRGRVTFEPLDRADQIAPTPTDVVQCVRHEPEYVEIKTHAAQPGRVVLTDLAYPGWAATMDGVSVETRLVDGMYRGVDVPAGEHLIAWKYRPASVYWGAWLSGASALVWLALGSVRFWHPQWLQVRHIA